MHTAIIAALAYLIGSLPFAVIVSRALGLADPRSYGSGNPGATNVLRSGSRKAAILTLIGDALKGVVAVLLAKAAAEIWNLSSLDVAVAGLFAFLGHVFSIFLRFRGGKGVATAAGVLFGMHAGVGALTLCVWLLTAATTRYSSASALAAAIAAPALTAWIVADPHWVGASCAMSAILIWRHKENIGRLLKGQESRIGSGRKTE
jgi:glycerol-3-phosphate acyltransferase PlsY